MKHYYLGKTAVITTQHYKENILRKPFFKILGLNLMVPEGLDTDLLGTFTGEIARIDTMENTAIKKAKMGIEKMGCEYGIASEGSFGPHPYLPYLPGHQEVLVFVDTVNNLILKEKMFTYKTNFSFCEVFPQEDISIYLKNIGFPRHGMVVKPNMPITETDNKIYKGIVNFDELMKIIKIAAAASLDGKAHLQTDMRAHMNPRRRKIIRKLAFRLIRRLTSFCKSCGLPGLGLVDTELGLPCESCGTPTEFVLNEIHGCAKCAYTEKIKPKAGLNFANPQYCSYCNP